MVSTDSDPLASQAEALRSFNRFYTSRLGLLHTQYLNTEFSLTEARILYELAHNSGVTAASLRRSLALDAGYMSRLLASFEQRQFIERKPARQDKRVLTVKLTRSGKRTASRLDRQSSHAMTQLLQTIPAQARITVTEYLSRVQEILMDADSSPHVVRATLSEAADARLLLKEYYSEVGVIQRDTPQKVRTFFSSPDAALWIAYVDRTPAGCVVLRPLPQFPASAECKRLYVRSQFRRRGIAEALLDAMEAFARNQSLSWIYLDSKDDLQAAIALYRRRGYTPCDPYNANPQATVFLRLNLHAENKTARS